MAMASVKSPSAVMQTEYSILAAFEEHGSRMTWPRRQLAMMLARRTDSFSAEEIVAGLPGLGRATIYRSIRLLVEAGILCKAAMPDGTPRYTVNCPHHLHHLVCIACGGISEFRHPAFARTLNAIRTPTGDQIIGHRLELYHRCAACRGSVPGGEAVSVYRSLVHAH